MGCKMAAGTFLESLLFSFFLSPLIDFCSLELWYDSLSFILELEKGHNPRDGRLKN